MTEILKLVAEPEVTLPGSGHFHRVHGVLLGFRDESGLEGVEPPID
jgi:hypothetical protein